MTNVYRLARGFGRGRLFSAWLQVRFWTTGRTGKYSIRPRNCSRFCGDREDRGELSKKGRS